MSDDEGEMCYSSGGGFTFIDRAPTGRQAFGRQEVKLGLPYSRRPRKVQLAGYASVFNKVHRNPKTDELEVFSQGCFARALHDGRAIRFLVRHQEGKCLATSADDLELLSDDHGLAFLCFVNPDGYFANEAIELVKSKDASMSVGYQVIKDEIQTIEGYKVRFLRDVSLVEVSLCPPGKGAVREAFCFALEDKSRTLRELSESKWLAQEWSTIQLRRAFGTFSDQVKALAK
jgi:HK97 family phage prohead protease